jgi:D-alanyl-D-alanine carboxypeptidase
MEIMSRNRVPGEDPRDEQIDAYLTAEVERHSIPGLSATVLRDNHLIHLAGYGEASVEWGAPATADTIYELASVTKPFTAVAVLLLVEDDALGLDDPVNSYFPDAPEGWREMTIRHLLAHSSGIPDYFNLPALQLEDDFAWRLDFSHETLRSIVFAASLRFAPGEQTAYSNTGYSLLGMLIERVTGQTYEAFLTERLFRPLDMTATRRNSRVDLIPRRAAGYVRDDGILQNAPYTSMTWAYAEGGIVSSARDLARWDAALSAEDVLPRARLDEMWTPTDDDLPAMGLGWTVNSSDAGTTIGHSGGKPGFATYYARFPDISSSVIVLINQSGVPIVDIGRGLALQLASS